MGANANAELGPTQVGTVYRDGGTVLAPGAAAAIASVVVADDGLYHYRVTGIIGPQLPIAENDIGNMNVQVIQPGGSPHPAGNLDCLPVGGPAVPSEIEGFINLGDGATFSVQATLAATAGVRYAASINLTKVRDI